MEIAAMY